MSPQRNMKSCNQSQTTSPWTEAYHAQAASSPTTPRAAEQTMPELASEHEAQSPTQDALSAIYNRGY